MNTKTFADLVSEQATSIQSACSKLIDFTIGSVLRAITEANAAIGVWLQQLIVELLATTRAATSKGADLDSWMSDFGLTRQAAVASTGNVTFSRHTATQKATVQVGDQVETADGSQTFSVTKDTSNSYWSTTASAYVLASGVSSAELPVQADTAGAAGNVAAGQIDTVFGSIPGIDSVSNASPLQNGKDAETDSEFRARFRDYMASLEKGTKSAVEYSIEALQQGLIYTFTENQDYNGTQDDGYFYVVIDDGTGSPSSTLLSTVSNAIDAVRPVTSRFGVFAPTVTNVTAALKVTALYGYTLATVQANVKTAIQDYIDSLPIGKSLYYTKLISVAYGVAGVDEVSNVTLNGGTSDVTANAKHVIKYSSVNIS